MLGKLCLSAALAALQVPAGQEPEPASQQDLTDLSLEALLSIEVTTVSRREESLNDVAAAVFVITQEDIRRSGHTSIPELLRMVPGLHVARLTSNTWAISSRGFNGRFTDKLLVMIDGRTVYTNLFSGVFWDVQDLLLEDVERIEVIRGPGGASWGANAVNGVIHVITKRAADTQGSFATVLAGNEERGAVGARHGGKLGSLGHWRVSAKWFERDSSEDLAGGEQPDAWHARRASFRMDFDQIGEDSFTLQGDLYGGRARERDPLLSTTPPFDGTFKGTTVTDGGNLLGRVTHRFSETSECTLQAFFDVTNRESDLFRDDRDTLDLDFQHRLQLSARNDFVWGAGYRHVHGSLGTDPNLEFTPHSRSDQLSSLFLQDEVAVAQDLEVVVGAKLEHNDYTGFELQPSLRASWTPSDEQAVWAAVSRAVRTPSVVDDDVIVPIGVIPGLPPTFVILSGNEDFESEELIAYEIGCRARPWHNVSLDLTAFYFDYENLSTIETGTPFFDGTNIIVPATFANMGEAHALGFEMSCLVQVSEPWRLRGGITLLDIETEVEPGSTDTTVESEEGSAPEFQASLLSYYDLSETVELDLGIYAVDELPSFDVPGYLRADARVAWKPSDALELSIVLQNATDDGHQEFGPEILSDASIVERGVYAQLAWRP